MRTVGSMNRKIFNASPGMNPCRNDLMNFLSIRHLHSKIMNDPKSHTTKKSKHALILTNLLLAGGKVQPFQGLRDLPVIGQWRLVSCKRKLIKRPIQRSQHALNHEIQVILTDFPSRRHVVLVPNLLAIVLDSYFVVSEHKHWLPI